MIHFLIRGLHYFMLNNVNLFLHVWIVEYVLEVIFTYSDYLWNYEPLNITVDLFSEK